MKYVTSYPKVVINFYEHDHWHFKTFRLIIYKKEGSAPRHRGLGGKYSQSVYLDEEGRGFESRRGLI